MCTINTSETELILRTYMVTPTSTGGPEIQITNVAENESTATMWKNNRYFVKWGSCFVCNNTYWGRYVRWFRWHFQKYTIICPYLWQDGWEYFVSSTRWKKLEFPGGVIQKNFSSTVFRWIVPNWPLLNECKIIRNLSVRLKLAKLAEFEIFTQIRVYSTA